MTENFKNFIGGQWVAPATGAYFENRNPADRDDVIGCFPRSGPDDVARAVASAQRGFALWSKTPAPVRGEVLHRVGDLLVERKDTIARAMTREMGKVLAETRGDVQEGIDTAHYAHTEGRRLFGRTVPSELRNKWAMSFRRPIGVAGLITPFNFPLAIPTWKMFPALHRDAPPGRARAGARPAAADVVRSRRPAAARARPGRAHRCRTAHQRRRLAKGRVLRGRRPPGRRARADRRRAGHGRGARARLVLPADRGDGRRARHAGRAAGDVRPGARADQSGLARRGDPRQ